MSAPKLPTPREFLLSVPLYTEFEFSREEGWDVLDLIYFSGTYDSYCIKCERDSTFQVNAPNRPPEHVRNHNLEKMQGKPTIPSIVANVYRVTATCTRQKSHFQDFLFFADLRVKRSDEGDWEARPSIQKIGQQPSFGDVHLAKVKKYAAALTKAQLGELSRAIGLASHDVGIGSYVYLRRVFESLVEESHQEAKSDSGWDEETYARSRMSEKIALLRSHLPAFLAEHPEMYSLLSKGVHELSEAECLGHFDTLRIGIELILDQKLERKERESKIKAAKAALAKAVSKV
ncbi:hypothetical protein [Lysobacter sp. P5_B9]